MTEVIYLQPASNLQLTCFHVREKPVQESWNAHVYISFQGEVCRLKMVCSSRAWAGTGVTLRSTLPLRRAQVPHHSL